MQIKPSYKVKQIKQNNDDSRQKPGPKLYSIL